MNNIEVFMVMSAKLEIERLEREASFPLAAEYKQLRPSEVRRSLLPSERPALQSWRLFLSRLGRRSR